MSSSWIGSVTFTRKLSGGEAGWSGRTPTGTPNIQNAVPSRGRNARPAQSLLMAVSSLGSIRVRSSELQRVGVASAGRPHVPRVQRGVEPEPVHDALTPPTRGLRPVDAPAVLRADPGLLPGPGVERGGAVAGDLLRLGD